MILFGYVVKSIAKVQGRILVNYMLYEVNSFIFTYSHSLTILTKTINKNILKM